MERPLGLWITLCCRASHSLTSTPKCLAPARTKTVRMPAPKSLMGEKRRAMLRELSANWIASSETGNFGVPPGKGFARSLIYLGPSASLCFTWTRDQSASSSSARTAARLERVPWPISVRGAMMMKVPSSRMLTYALSGMPSWSTPWSFSSSPADSSPLGLM